ncbi:hypothetical protein [Rubrivirga marina]|uniref:hypothetical protein n=1 Tax=Rubrivirga marina TaxID=1196024 RepID=UPI0015CCBE18|nr:hypothetical protein [Rubrivirga marina]
MEDDLDREDPDVRQLRRYAITLEAQGKRPLAEAIRRAANALEADVREDAETEG